MPENQVQVVFIVDEISFFVVRQTRMAGACSGEKKRRKKETKNATILKNENLPARCLISKSPFLVFFFALILSSQTMDIAEGNCLLHFNPP